MEKNAFTSLCGNHAQGVKTALDFFQPEIHKRKEVRQSAKAYKKELIKKINVSDIDEIMSRSFGPRPRYMAEVRQCYFDTERRAKLAPLRESVWNFNATNFISQCAKVQIDSSKKANEIQWLYIPTLTVAEVLRKDNKYITANAKDEIKKAIHQLCLGLGTDYDIQYWKVIFKYFSKCAIINDLIVLLPQCKSEYINNWLRQLEDFASPHRRKWRCALEYTFSFLEDFSKELHDLTKCQANISCTEEEIEKVFYPLTISELYYTLSNKYVVSAISKNKLRADDLRVAYFVLTQLNDEYKEIFYDSLTEELNLEYAIAY